MIVILVRTTKIFEDMVNQLHRPFIVEEVVNAMRNLRRNEAPGPYGIPGRCG